MRGSYGGSRAHIGVPELTRGFRSSYRGSGANKGVSELLWASGALIGFRSSYRVVELIWGFGALQRSYGVARGVERGREFMWARSGGRELENLHGRNLENLTNSSVLTYKSTNKQKRRGN